MASVIWNALARLGVRVIQLDTRALVGSRHLDWLQVLAYGTSRNTRDTVGCLVYPCTQNTWESLARRDRLFSQAELPHRGRRVRVWLTAMPMSAATDTVAAAFVKQMRLNGL